MSTILKIRDLKKSYGENIVFSGLNLLVEKHKVTVIYGKSGIGKTSLLKCLVLLDIPEEGSIEVEGVNIIANGVVINEEVVRNKIGVVFQDFYLWDNKTVLNNIIEALINVKKVDKEEAIEAAYEVIKKLHLAKDLLNKYPPELSRGQRQRVAIARTLVMDPDIVLFDEPTASLDEVLVDQVSEIIKLLRNSGKTILVVSHDSRLVKNVGDNVFDFESLVKR